MWFRLLAEKRAAAACFKTLLCGQLLAAAMWFGLLLCASRGQAVILSEFMADNVTAAERDEDGERADWIELENVSGDAVAMNGWYLTDERSNLRKWQFPVGSPEVSVLPGARLIVWASGKNRKASVDRLHTNFKLDKDGEYLGLVRPDGVTVVHSYAPAFPPQIMDGTYGVAASDPAILPPVETVAGQPQVSKRVRVGYLLSSTRGVANSETATAIGPIIAQVTKRSGRPAGGEQSTPIAVTARVIPTLRPLAGNNPVVLKWRRMYGEETSINMVFNAGTRLYAAEIPTTSLLSGEMIRWRVEARDDGVTPSYGYAPEFPFGAAAPPSNPPPKNLTADLDQYYGTVAQDGISTSKVPILHWFAESPGAADTLVGESCSFFFQPIPLHPAGTAGYALQEPKFYDNVRVYRHGQSTANLPQKSHNFSFNKANRFKWKDGDPALRSVNLLSTYADKSKVRNSLAYYVWELSGHYASHFSQLVRVEQNGAFKGIYDFVEDGNEDFIQRERLDPLGSLYKIYNSLENANRTETNRGGAEKKNPKTSDYTDLQALVRGISDDQPMTVRLRYVYDNVDVASLINFLAVHTLILNRDTGHNNYYVFRDTANTGEWSLLPWDQDLSFGHTWTFLGQDCFDDDIHSGGPLKLAGRNRLMQIVFGCPELNVMFVERVRSLASQFLVSSSCTNGPLEKKINDLLNQIDPNPDNPANGADDADLNTRTWGFWVDGSGSKIAHTDSRMAHHTVRAQANRIFHSNPHPPYPGANPYPGFQDNSSSLPAFLPGRRAFMFNANPPKSGAMPLPASVPLDLTLYMQSFDFNPAEEAKDQEYFIIRNPNDFAVDLSGWQLSGEVSMTFRGGTVIPGLDAETLQNSNSTYVNQLIVAKKPLAIRQRSTSPRANEYRQVSGPYEGRLSGRGGMITLSRPNDPFNPKAGYNRVASATLTPGAVNSP